MPVTATTVMNGSRAYLNDTAIDLFTDAVLLPYLKMANLELQDKCLVYGIEVNRKASAFISVAAAAVSVTLPSDFLLPINLWERDVSGTEGDWAPMFEKMWDPKVLQTTTLNYWSFRNDVINLIGATVAKEVKLEYERSLAVVATGTDNIDAAKFERFLAAITAEKAARYVGNNKVKADSIRDEESIPAGWDLAQYLTLNQQGIRQRRSQFTTKKASYLVT